jgi:hypothetical protein
MVGQAALNRSIGVRLPVSQPRFISPLKPTTYSFGERRGLELTAEESDEFWSTFAPPRTFVRTPVERVPAAGARMRDTLSHKGEPR